MSTLSRRNFFTRVAVVAAAVPAAVAVAVPATLSPALAIDKPPAATPLVPSDEPSAIARLWQRHEVIRGQYRTARREHKRLEAKVRRRLGAPDPAITYGEESEALGIDDSASRVDSYIWPRYIEAALRKTVATTTVLRQPRLFAVQEIRTLRQEILCARPRLKELLKLSRRHDQKVKRMSSELGVEAAAAKMDQISVQQVDIAARILEKPCVARSDLTIKFAVNDLYGDDWAAESIMRDMRRLMKGPSILANALAAA